MGLRSACYIAQCTTNAIRWMFEQDNLEAWLRNYLDDFYGAEESHKAQQSFDGLATLFHQLGVEESSHKAVEPMSQGPVLGIWFNAETATMAIPPQKLCEIQALLAKWQWKRLVSRKELESLLGKLHLMSQCVQAGHVMVNRLLTFLRGMPHLGKRDLSDEARLDIKWWHDYLPESTGVTMLQLHTVLPEALFETDSMLHWARGVRGNEYFTIRYPESVTRMDPHFVVLEMWAVVIALKVWKDHLGGSALRVKCDNVATLHAINSGSMHSSAMAAVLREISYVLSRIDSVLIAEYVLSRQNVLPDLLSQWDNHEARDKFFNITEA